MPLVINSHGGAHTHKHTCTQTFADRSNSKKSGSGRCVPDFKTMFATVHNMTDKNNSLFHFKYQFIVIAIHKGNKIAVSC